MQADHILIKGLKQNNLKNVSLEIPKNKIVVFTGVSGSGKSSIVFDTIAAESHRQMSECPISARHRTFLLIIRTECARPVPVSERSWNWISIS